MFNGYRFIAPEYAALINPIACNAFAMRCEGRQDIEERRVVATGDSLDGPTVDAVVLDTVIETPVCDAKMFILPFIKLLNCITPEYASRFYTSRFTFDIDGELVVNSSAVENHLLCPACIVCSQPTTSFTMMIGCPCETALLGTCQMFFLPNGTRIRATLEDIPSGGGDLNINTGAILVDYTTKARQGCLFGVGALDAAQQAYPVTYPCPATFGAAVVGEAAVAAPGVAVSGPGAGVGFGPASLG